jgi:hypothetical protein
MCSIVELTKKVEERIKDRTNAETVSMLREAKIIDRNGYLHEGFFSKSDVEKSRESTPILM